MGIENYPGSFGVMGVKRSFFTKNASTPLDYVALTRDLYIWYSLTPSTKVMGIENHAGSFGVMGVKRSFSPKMLQLL